MRENQSAKMDDLISRQAAIDALKQLQKNISGDYTELDPMVMAGTAYIGDCIGELQDMPSAQPEIIRCRDCIAYQEGIDIDGKPFTRCNGINGSVRTYGHTLPDWYCADAERRTDETD